MAKKDPKRTRNSPPPAAKSKAHHAVHAAPASHPKESGGGSESEIRRLDREILKLVNRRAALTVKQIQSRSSSQKLLFAPLTDEHLVELIEKGNSGPLAEPAVRGIFREMITGARSAVKMTRVAYLGPSYSFTHLAAIERFGTSATFIPVNNIAAVFEEVNRGHADYGIAPIENSTDGRVVDTLDMFTRLPLKICGEVQLAIHHNLMARCQRSEITEIYSKPQALSQCRNWLAKHLPTARPIEVTSTSAAAQIAFDKLGAAAIASVQAAAQYGLEIIAESIEDNPDNITRFAVIGADAAARSGRDKTAAMFQIEHRPGSLAEAINIFKRNRLNLTWIESFPISHGEYLFFIELDGHESDLKVRRALQALAKKTLRFEILGSCPRTEPVG
jgi:chorismate mutase/prephenate dehydratase